MITGFNTDVEYGGRVFHVQTEDKGRTNPVVESLVYSGGEIVGSRRTSYADLVEASEATEPVVQRRMEVQHQTLIREIRNGRFDPEGPRPFGSHIVSDRSLDEVILDFLRGQAGLEPIRLEMNLDRPLQEGTAPSVRFRVLAESSGMPIAGARVAVKMISTLDRPHEMFAGETNPDGWVEAVLDLPRLVNGNSALVCQAEVGERCAEVHHLVRKAEASAG
jgi:hypothetical protein